MTEYVRFERDVAPAKDILSSWSGAAVALVNRIVDALLLWQERAAQRYHLRGLSDEALKDVGLTRADIHHETTKHFWAP